MINNAVREIAAFGALATRYRQYDSRLAPFCAGSLEPQARSAMGQEDEFRLPGLNGRWGIETGRWCC